MTGYYGGSMVSKEEEASMGKKYGGIVPKKPLISKIADMLKRTRVKHKHYVCQKNSKDIKDQWVFAKGMLYQSISNITTWMDNGRAFFDSADWALGKHTQQGAGEGQTTRTAVESLRPKLQRTPHQQLPPRRPTCTSGYKDNMGD